VSWEVELPLPCFQFPGRRDLPLSFVGGQVVQHRSMSFAGSTPLEGDPFFPSVCSTMFPRMKNSLLYRPRSCIIHLQSPFSPRQRVGSALPFFYPYQLAPVFDTMETRSISGFLFVDSLRPLVPECFPVGSIRTSKESYFSPSQVGAISLCEDGTASR